MPIGIPPRCDLVFKHPAIGRGRKPRKERLPRIAIIRGGGWWWRVVGGGDWRYAGIWGGVASPALLRQHPRSSRCKSQFGAMRARSSQPCAVRALRLLPASFFAVIELPREVSRTSWAKRGGLRTICRIRCSGVRLTGHRPSPPKIRNAPNPSRVCREFA